MTDDGLRSLLERLEEDVPPIRPAVATTLHDRLATELGLLSARPTMGSRWSAWREAFRPRTMRSAALLAALLLLAMAAIALAGAVLRAWLTSPSMGLQHTDEFALTELARDPEAAIFDLQLDGDGRRLLGLRDWFERLSMTSPDAGVVRYEPAPDGDLTPRIVVPLAAARDPALWAPGAALEGAVIHQSIGGMPRHAFSLASDGGMFLSLALYPDDDSPGPLATTVIHSAPDGTLQRVLTDADLVADDRFEGLDHVLSIMVVASAPDLLWGRVEGPLPDGSRAWWFQVLDPTSDGDWSDRVIQPLTLPDSVPHRPAGDYFVTAGALEPEPSVDGRDRTRSVLWPAMDLAGRFTVHRLTDADLDGDLTDPGEVELVASALAGSEVSSLFMPLISPRVVLDGDRVMLDELVAGGLTRSGRVSRMTPTGPVDVVRGVPMVVDGIVADRAGGIFVVFQAWDESGTRYQLVDRLDPLPAGADGAVAHASPDGEVAPVPLPSALVPNAPVSTTGPWIAVQLQGSGREELLLVGPDGSGPARAVEGEHIQGACPTADGERLIVRAQTEAPGETWTFAADADGTAMRVVSERFEPIICGTVSEAVLLGAGREDHRSIIRHDLATGAETVLAEDVVVLGLSPDGTRLAVADGEARQILTVLDIRTGEGRALADAGGSSVRAAWWSPDGTALAWLSGRPAGWDPSVEEAFVVQAVGSDGSPGSLRLPITGRLPMASWSADGGRLGIATPDGEAWLADVEAGTARSLGTLRPRWIGWSPTDPDTLAVAAIDGIHLVTEEGADRLLRGPLSANPCPVCDREVAWEETRWLGWSPDGRWIGLGRDSGAVALVDAATGEVRVPFASSEEVWIADQAWWP